MSSTPDARTASVRYPCPVCLGVQMAKLKPDAALDLELDHCERCGGIWFDQGEADQLRRSTPQTLAARVKLGDKAWVMQCHACHAAMHRNAAQCPACGWKNELECPSGRWQLAPVLRDGLKLDVCRHCRGAWFDNVELAEIWNRSVAALERRRGVHAPERYQNDFFFLDAFFLPLYIGFPPFGHAAHVPGGATPDAGGVGSVDTSGAGDVGDVGDVGSGDVGDVAGGIVDSAGEAAGGVFDWVADFFDGFDF